MARRRRALGVGVVACVGPSLTYASVVVECGAAFAGQAHHRKQPERGHSIIRLAQVVPRALSQWISEGTAMRMLADHVSLMPMKRAGVARKRASAKRTEAAMQLATALGTALVAMRRERSLRARRLRSQPE